MTSREDARAYDAADPLASVAAEFVVTDPDLIYFDGNSLGRLPLRTLDAVADVARNGWGDGLVRSWHEWLDLGQKAGAKLAPLIGAAASDVAVCDQTSLNLYKLAAAALDAASGKDIITDDSNFPSDRYVLAEVARRAGGEVRTMTSDPIAGPSADDVAEHLDAGVGLVSLSQVAYRSGAIADMDAISNVARAAGAFTLWDLSHSAGAIPVELGSAGADLAVGCTYKYLNGGPGAPAFVYVRSGLQDELQQPIQGWYSHNSQFDFDGEYTPAPDIRRFLIGTPPILSMVGAIQGIELCAEIGIDALRDKSKDLTALFIDLFDERLASRGFSLVTPRDDEQRGSHVTLTHAEAYRITRALIDVDVVPDYRDPGAVRFGIAPAYTSAVQVWDGVDRLVAVVDSAAYESHDRERERVT